MPTFAVNNIVATANLGTSIHLPLVVLRFPSCEYNRKKFAAMTVRLVRPAATCLIFGSGRVVCTGARSMEGCRLAVCEVWKMVYDTGYTQSRVVDFHVQNIVANFAFGKPIQLERLYQRFQNESNFAPELFPGLVMRFDNTKTVYLVFDSGKAVITGSSSETQVAERANHLQGILTDTYGPPNAEGATVPQPTQRGANR